MRIRVLLLALLAVAVAGAGASGQADPRTVSLSYSIRVPGSFYLEAPVGGGICAGGGRVTDPAEDSGGSWSRDGRYIVFARRARGRRSDLYLADAAGTSLRKLTHTPRIAELDPDWSPDGRRIVYAAATARGWALNVMNRNGSARRRLALAEVGASSGSSWSPDGTLIAYTASDGVRVIRPDGSGDTLVVRRGYDPDWAPDGRRLVFVVEGDVATANADGSGVALLERTEYYEDRPQWSPGGSTIVFERDLSTVETRGHWMPTVLIAIAPDGSRERQLATPGRLEVFDVAWRSGARAKLRPCVISGTRRRDVLRGTQRGDLMFGGDGNDVVRGLRGADVLVGDEGRDLLSGGDGGDAIDAEDGWRDVVDGGRGSDLGASDANLDRVRSIERKFRL